MKPLLKRSVNWPFAFIPVTVSLEYAHVPPPVIFLSAALSIISIARIIAQTAYQPIIV
jgi:Ca2+/H+ antiporter